MGMAKIRYYEGYKYQLAETYEMNVGIVGYDVKIGEYVHLWEDGTLIIYKGYAWDGASGPTWDSKSSMRASLIHDALYQLMGVKKKLLDYRLLADDLLCRICKEDGMWSVRAFIWRKAVNWFGRAYAADDEQPTTAP